MDVGKISMIYRYPIKSMQGQLLHESSVTVSGLPGDRAYAWEKNNSPGNYLTISKAPYLLDYYYNFKEITFTKAGELTAQSVPEIEAELTLRAGFQVRLKKMNLKRDGPAYWEAPLLITTTASLKAMTKSLNRAELNILRFRPNLVIELKEDTPFLEESWIGKNLELNNVILNIKKGCKRCAYVNVDPTTREVDTNVLKTVAKEHGMNFGVYASVVKIGTVQKDNVVII